MPAKPSKNMARRKISGMSTGATIALVGGGALLLYMVMKKSTTPTVITVPSTTSTAANQTTALAGDATSVLNNILGLFS